jgi:hypothetical protein
VSLNIGAHISDIAEDVAPIMTRWHGFLVGNGAGAWRISNLQVSRWFYWWKWKRNLKRRTAQLIRGAGKEGLKVEFMLANSGSWIQTLYLLFYLPNPNLQLHFRFRWGFEESIKI